MQVPKRLPPGTLKKKFCMYNLQGVCKYSSDQCSFAHSLEEMHQTRKPLPNLAGNLKRDTSRWKETRHDDGLPKNRLRPGDASFEPSARKQEAKAWAHMVEPMFVKPPPPREVWTSETTAWTSEGLKVSHFQPFSSAYGLELGLVPQLPFDPIPSPPPALAGGTWLSTVPEPPGLSDVTCTRTLEWLTR